jgi:hypothetical protein
MPSQNPSPRLSQASNPDGGRSEGRVKPAHDIAEPHLLARYAGRRKGPSSHGGKRVQLNFALKDRAAGDAPLARP